MTRQKQTPAQEVAELVDLAFVYFEDGAPRTAAKRLRLAAEKLDAMADHADRLFAGEPA